MAETSGWSVNDGPTVPPQFGAAPNPHNRTVLGFATKSGKAEISRRLSVYLLSADIGRVGLDGGVLALDGTPD